MNKNAWIATADLLPNTDRVVETRILDAKGERNLTELRFSRRLWWFPDMSMYVYYAPTHWRETV